MPSAPDQIRVADITYVHLAKTFAYLAVILDAFSRKPVGWAFEETLDASLAIAALEKAIAGRGPAPGSLIHHSDRGVQGGFKRPSQHQLFCTHDSSSSGASAGVLQRLCRSGIEGRCYSEYLVGTVDAQVCAFREARSPLVFSLVPRCQGLCGSRK